MSKTKKEFFHVKRPDPLQQPIDNQPVAVGQSGALSSSKKIRYDLLPRTFLERIAERFELGTRKYPPFNYKQGLEDKEFIIDRLNHLQEHVQAYLSPKDSDDWNDDNLAGIGWAVSFLMECETTEIGREVIAKIRMERSVRYMLQ
jgi:hypothetical protein